MKIEIDEVLTSEEIQALKNAKNSEGEILNIYHNEKDTYEHTNLVLNNVHNFFANDKEYKILQLAAILHDIGKTITRVVGVSGKVTFPKHERKGAVLALAILKRVAAKFNLSYKDIRDVVYIVKYHDIYKYKIEELVQKHKHRDLVLVAKLSLCDNLGRISNVATDVTHQKKIINLAKY